jgi:phosphoribosyl 1,2-cyclic phosphodiesterase
MVLDLVEMSGQLAANKIDWLQIERTEPLVVPTYLELRFWGTRGSIPVSGPANVRYGGNTSCVSLSSDAGHLFVFDCGSGLRELGTHLLKTGAGQPINGYLLLSHTHWDHIQGFPFFAPVFRPGNRFNILGWSNQFQSLTSVLAGQMEQRYFPVSLYSLPAELAFYSLNRRQREILIDGAKLTTHLLKHPLPSVAYRLELGGKSLVYATDQEPLKLPDPQPDRLLGDDVIDPKLIELAYQADILIHDAQYSNAQLFDKVGWGHSSVEVAVDTAIRARVKQLILFHHDPAHDDATLDHLLELARQRAHNLGYSQKLEIIAAHDGLTLKLAAT